jgi:2-polyprenyl-3-methyl-5-hydroxy-6-metoxy-1,4-benzoquinol methylase
VTDTQSSDYQEKLAQEAALWGAEAERQAQELPPDWRYHRHTPSVVIVSGPELEKMLALIQPGMKVLELGCNAGWLAVEVARRGADVHGLDISGPAIEVARQYYAEIEADLPGTATYEVADLNNLSLPAATYDLIYAKATLHHLEKLDALIAEVQQALKPGGLCWVMDTNGDEATSTVLVASALMFILPTVVSYGDKFRGLLRFGTRAPSRIKASMQAEGLSPFEGAGREHDWLALLHEHFTVEKTAPLPAFTGYITAQIKLPRRIGIPLLRFLRAIDLRLVRWGLLHNSGVVVYARRAPAAE